MEDRTGGLVELYVVIGFFVLLIHAMLGGWVASQKGRNGLEGFVLGFFFGPLGVLVESNLPELEDDDEDVPASQPSTPATPRMG
jgi:hypothetical protein